ncbi:MAG: hypothetical protein ABI925_11635 [Verrucomicrobiota bacterium]
MPPETPSPVDLLDLKLMPAWLKETETKSYDHYTGEEGEPRGRGRRDEGRRGPGGGRDDRGRRPTPNSPQRSGGAGAPRPTTQGRRPDSREPRKGGRDQARPGGGAREAGPRDRGQDRQREHRAPAPQPAPIDVTVRFMPRTPVLESVITQVRSGSVAYSLFHLARLFLEKPERYEVRLTAKPETPLFQLGEGGPVGSNRQFLEESAFRLSQEDFYKVDITQGEPIKGNFTSVARDRLSGTLLGPTNHHAYQPRLRTLYEQRFSRRMSFPDYQRQIEIVNDPALVERWKEEAQRVTTYTTVREEPPSAFSSVTDAEKHFRTTYLPSLVRGVEEVAIGGVQSRRLTDRGLHRAIEDAWTQEVRSPSNIMQELAGQFRQVGLNVFRHRRGMLFVSPIRARPLVHDHAGLSLTVNAILQAITKAPKIGRKELADALIPSADGEDGEARKLALASDLHWLVSEGHVIEFNDGSLDLPREKTKPVTEGAPEAEGKAGKDGEEPAGSPVAAIDAPSPDGSGAGGSGERPLPEANTESPVRDRQPEPAPQVLDPDAEIGGG